MHCKFVPLIMHLAMKSNNLEHKTKENLKEEQINKVVKENAGLKQDINLKENLIKDRDAALKLMDKNLVD